MPVQWSRDKCAGPDWFSGFMKRIRTQDATSLSRATSFNKKNSVDGLTGVKQIWALTSGERGSLVTMLFFLGSNSRTILSMMDAQTV